MSKNDIYCFGCGQLVETLTSHCACVDAENARMTAEVEKWKADHKNDPLSADPAEGFAGFQGILPMRASLKALSKIKVTP